ncbi:protein takeout-like [Periplaneta americana]|uniref:protein takeout-like n=1 Tax=Periplaneta americana TaxID=6978 RepID=UPI0037E93588
MLHIFLAALLATSALAAPSATGQWPNFEPCSVNSPDFKTCAKNNIQLALKEFSGGIPVLGVPSFDPLYLSEVLVDYKQDGVEGKMLIKNTTSYGIKKAEVLDIRTNLSDPSNMAIDVDFRMPSVFIEGQYKAEGKIVAFPISGKGVFNNSLTDVRGTWGLRGDLVTIDGEEYMKIRHVYMYPEVGDMKVYASNLFTGNEELNKAALRFANLYWPAFYKELLPFVAESWDSFMREFLNKFFLKVPFKTIFPEN